MGDMGIVRAPPGGVESAPMDLDWLGDFDSIRGQWNQSRRIGIEKSFLYAQFVCFCSQKNKRHPCGIRETYSGPAAVAQGCRQRRARGRYRRGGGVVVVVVERKE